MKGRSIKRRIADLLLTAGITAAIGVMYIPMFLRLDSYIGESGLAQVKKALIITLVCNAAAVLFVLCFLIMFILEIIRTSKEIKTLRRFDTDIAELEKEMKKPPEISRRLYLMTATTIIVYILLILAAAAVVLGTLRTSNTIMSTTHKENNPIRVIRSLRAVIDDEKVGETKTVLLKGVNTGIERELLPSAERGERDSYVNYCYLAADEGRRLPVSERDRIRLINEAARQIEGRYVLRVEYYEKSGLIKSYSFEESRWEAEEYDKPEVEISLDDELVLHRPENMEEYGDIAWVISKDGEMLLNGGGEKAEPYTITAQVYDSVDLKSKAFFHSERGSYSAQLVKVFVYKDPETGRYDIFDTVPISNSVTFDIADGSDIVKALDGEKLKIAYDEESREVSLPELPGNYKVINGVSLIIELTGEDAKRFGSEDVYKLSYDYTGKGSINIPDYTGHFKIYDVALDENGEEAVISDIIEFDNISRSKTELENEKRQKREYFDWLLDALENDDTEAIKSRLSKGVTAHEKEWLDSDVKKLCELFKGRVIDRDSTEPELDDYISAVDGSHLCSGSLDVKTDSGSYRISLDTCYKSDDSGLVGVYRISVRNIDTNKSAFINDGEHI